MAADFDIRLTNGYVIASVYPQGEAGFTIYFDQEGAKQFFAAGLCVAERDAEKRFDLVREGDVLEGIDAEAASLYYRHKWEESLRDE